MISIWRDCGGSVAGLPPATATIELAGMRDIFMRMHR